MKQSKYNISSILNKINIYITFQDTIQDFHQKLLAANKAELTIQTYLQDILSAIKFFYKKNNENLLDHFPTQLISWRLLLQEKFAHLQPSTQNKFLQSLKIYANLSDNVLHQTLQKMHKPKITKYFPKPLSIEQINLLLNNEKHTWIQKRDHALYILLYGAGLRISEALSLRMNDIQNSNTTITITGKGNKIRTIPMLPQIQTQLLEYLESRPNAPNNALFIDKHLNPYTRIQAAKNLTQTKEKLGLPCYTSCHKLRHSFVSHLIENHACLKSIQKLAGHASLSTIQSYAQISVKHLAQAHAKGNNWEQTNKSDATHQDCLEDDNPHIAPESIF